MKQIYSYAMKLCMLVAVVLTAVQAKADDAKLRIEDFTIDSYETVQMPILMDNDFGVANVVVQVNLPDVLEFDTETTTEPYVTLSDRKGASMSVTFSANTGRIVVASLMAKTFSGNEGAILYVPIRVKSGALTSGTYDITLTDVSLAAPGAGSTTVRPNAFTAKVTLSAPAPDYTYELYPIESELTINPGQTKTITLGINNSGPVVSLMFDMKLPEGVTLDENSVALDYSRLSSNAMVVPTVNEDFVRFQCIDFAQVQQFVKTGTTGAILSFDVKASDSFTAANAEISIYNVEVGYTVADLMEGQGGCSITLVNGATFKAQADAKVQALRDELTAALATIAEQSPDVASQFAGEDITAQIDLLAEAIANAYADNSLATNYESIVTTPANAISEAIAKLISDAAAAQADKAEADRLAANQAAYEAAIAELDGLKAELDAAVAAARESYPDADIDAAVAAAQKAIDDAKAAAAAALDEANATAGASFAYTVPADAIRAAIAAVTTAANEQKAEADRLAANQTAYEAAIAELDGLKAELDAAVAAARESYPDADIDATVAAAQKAIDDAKAAAAAALDEANATAGASFAYTVPADAIRAAITAIADAGKAGQAEADRQAANQAAYDAAVAQIDDLQDELDDWLKMIALVYPSANVSAETAKAQDAINRAYADALAALQACADSGTFNYTVPTDEIKALIDAIVKAAQTSGIDGIPADEVENIEAIYTLDGLKVAAPRHGTTNIIVGKDGSVKKVFIK